MIVQMSPSTDAVLVQAFLDGEEAALGELVARHLDAVFRFVVRMLLDEDRARDVVQETFIKAWKSLPRYDKNRSFKTWLFTIAQRTTIDEIRKTRTVPFSWITSGEDEQDFSETIADTLPGAEQLMERAESEEALRELLAQLSESARAAVLLHDIEDLTFAEMSEVMEEPLHTIKSRYRRAYLRLQSLAKGAQDSKLECTKNAL